MPAQGGSKVEDLVVVGGGVIGLSCAWRAAQAGRHVTLRDPAPASGSSWVAGGMLAPVTEAWPGEEGLLELGLESLELWPAFAEELSAAAGQPAGLHPEGTVVAATGSGDRAELDALAGHLARLGRPVERLSGRELRRLEPGLGPDVRGGLSVPGDLSVDNRALLAALRAAAEKAGVVMEERAWEPGETAPGTVLICAGAHSAALHPGLAGLVRPVKGEILRLTHRHGAFPVPTRTVRALVDGRPVYLVPRPGGLVVGATQSEHGFDTEPTVGGVRDLLRDAERILPGIAEYALAEAAAGLRPGSPDNVPVVGRLDGRTLVATGHSRNGILLAPLTARLVVGLLGGGAVPAAVDPARFGRTGT
ncbi:glycine oxidase ThiO [Pseudonocardia sp. RS11V-5]|uniref:glycine oxidase ThiO n=1 Tax=Pseudonocardia terrae TaxID=2905831 RepID=UPI001E5468B1|nr:glycine oxidase ThiO [Pseudonocardia terrae]MCE3550587.1 glycine oxidase ThiO [Pseudonocardia terrae]